MENELCHYGVLGMKWGVRKDRRIHKSIEVSPGMLRKASSITNDARTVNNSVRSIRKKRSADAFDLYDMTDKELQAAVNRMNLERQYKSLKTENIAQGQQYLDDVLNVAGGALGIGASALAIAVSIKQLTK